MGRTMPVECEHGNIIDWGDFGNDDEDYGGAEPCPECEAKYVHTRPRVKVARWLLRWATK